MKLISDQYKAEQQHLHFTHPKSRKYGSGGPLWSDVINRIIAGYDCKTIIDYGCGKGLLAATLKNVSVQSYDPAVDKFMAIPTNADMVVCLDVLEHIEPELIDNVLNHLTSLADRLLFVTISQKKTARVLRDGRNAHLIIQNDKWWTDKIQDRQFGLLTSDFDSGERIEFVALFGKR